MHTRLVRAAASLLVAAVVLTLGYRAYDGDPAQAAPIRTIADAQPFGPNDYRAYLAEQDINVASARERSDLSPGEWLRQSSLAAALGRRARVAGSYDDWAAADAAMERALAAAPAGSGPLIGGASHHLALHRLDRAEALLDKIAGFAVRPDKSDRAEVEAMHGDIAFYRGDYTEAARRFAVANDTQSNPGTLVRLAAHARAMGNLDHAERLLQQAGGASEMPTRPLLAKLYLELANLEYGRGRWEAAAKHIEAANDAFPGYWLAQAYRAQLHALAGDTDAAIAAFERLVVDHPKPEILQILATLHREQGREQEADRLIARALSIWNERLAILPSAALGHAIEHHIKHGEPARALELAKLDYAARPHGSTAKMLAEAYLINEQPKPAEKLLREMERSGWRSTEMYLFLADAREAQGDTSAAKALRAQALAADPRALDPAREYLWFGHS